MDISEESKSLFEIIKQSDFNKFKELYNTNPGVFDKICGTIDNNYVYPVHAIASFGNLDMLMFILNETNVNVNTCSISKDSLSSINRNSNEDLVPEGAPLPHPSSPPLN